MKHFIKATSVFLLLFISTDSISQQKTINHQYQSWFSIGNTIKAKGKFGILTDMQVRRNNFFADPGFYLVTGAVNYWYSQNLSLALGYGHMWVAPPAPGCKTYSDENRIYQQIQLSSKVESIGLVQRIRNEQRWQEIIVSDVSTHHNKFTNRVRYLINATIPVSSNKKIPALIISDEVFLQFGKTVVYNTFDQNRLFIGIKQPINKNWSFDLGYLYLTQQKNAGYQYDVNDTFRWAFYYSSDWRKKK